MAIPIGGGELFTGIIDLLKMQAILYNEDSKGSSFDYVDIPDDLVSLADEWRSILIEEVATNDEHLMEKYLNDERSVTMN